MSQFDRNLIKEAVAKYGNAAQLDQLQEEACELAVALSHFRRKSRADEREVLAEIGDVYLMLEQARVIFGDDLVNESCAASATKLALRLGKDVVPY